MKSKNPSECVITPPTMLHNAPVGAIGKRGGGYPVHDPDAPCADLDPLHQGSDDLPAAHPQDRTVQEHILPARQILVKTCTKLNQRSCSSFYSYYSFIGL